MVVWLIVDYLQHDFLEKCNLMEDGAPPPKSFWHNLSIITKHSHEKFTMLQGSKLAAFAVAHRCYMESEIVWEISLIETAPHFRRQGVATSLVKHVEETLHKEFDACRIDIHPLDEAREFWEHIGYEKVSENKYSRSLVVGKEKIKKITNYIEIVFHFPHLNNFLLFEFFYEQKLIYKKVKQTQLVFYGSILRNIRPGSRKKILN